MQLNYTRPYLYPKQAEAIFTDKRFACIEASTKSGKTQGDVAWIIEETLFHTPEGGNTYWVAPVSDQAAIAYHRVKQGLTPGSFDSRESPTPRIFLAGRTIWFKSADKPDSLFGDDVWAVVVDEASRCKEESKDAVISTLTFTGGRGRFIGNVKGRANWFWKMCRLAEKGELPDAHYARITWRDAVEAGVLKLGIVEQARAMLPERTFRELYEAVASDDTGNPFGEDHIAECVRPLSTKSPVAFGIDVARRQDYYVIIGLDEDGCVCHISRWRDIPWGILVKRTHKIVGEDIPTKSDSTGVGDMILEALQFEHGNFQGYHFSPHRKQALMEGLVVAIQSHKIGFPVGPIVDELMTFEYEETPFGVKYSAPAGYFDDCVCALALAWLQFSEMSPGENVEKYMIAQTKLLTDRAANISDTQTQNLEQMSWITRSPEVDLENELNELYEQTLRQHPNLDRRIDCRRCNKPVTGPSRVTDGEFIWHMECAS